MNNSVAVAASTPDSRESSEFEFVPSCPPVASTPGATSAAASSSAQPEDGGLFGWVRGTGGGLLCKVAEKTKTSVESVITTLDPQMKEYLYSGGQFNIVVASDKEVKITPLRKAFQVALGRATVFGLPSQSVNVAAQPVGFAAGRQAAHERIQSLHQRVSERDTLVAVENFLLEVGDNIWVDMACLTLNDPARKIQLTSYSQPTPIDTKWVDKMKALTPDHYPKRWSGFAVSVGSIFEEETNVSKDRLHEVVCGLSRQDILLMAAKALAFSYKKALLAKVDTV